jgi:hypothetical protein
LERNLAGVAIWDLGIDSDNLSLWNSLGAALIYVDTVYRSPVPKPAFFSYAKLYFSDLLWASPNDIEIGPEANSLENQKLVDTERYCMWDNFIFNYELYKSYIKDSTELSSQDLQKLRPGLKMNFEEILNQEDSVARLLEERRNHINYLVELHKNKKNFFNTNDPNSVKIFFDKFSDILPWIDNQKFIDSATQCDCLAIRWEVYAKRHLIASLCFLVASLLIFSFVFFKTLKVGEEKFVLKYLLQSIAIGLFGIGILVFLGYLYFDIHFTYFGAASDEVPVWILTLVLIFGFILGAIYRKIQMARVYSKRDLP